MTNVNVGAVVVDLGVVDVKSGNIDSSLGHDAFAGLLRSDSVCGGAIFIAVAETDVVSRSEVGAVGINVVVVDGGELEPVRMELSISETLYERGGRLTWKRLARAKCCRKYHSP